MKNIFKDLIIVELASVLAGPLAGSFFAELGARVIKIENIKAGGDVTRQWKINTENQNNTISAYYASANTNKEVLMLDLENPIDQKKLNDLIKTAHVVISNFQKKTAIKLSVDYKSILKINNNIIFAQLVAYSYDDPRPGYDLVMQAEAGFISMTGTKQGEMVKIPVALMDVIAGHQIKEAVLIALYQKSNTNQGSYVETSLYKSAISALANQASNYLMTSHTPIPMGTLHPNIAPYGDIILTSDDISIILAVGSDNQFYKLGKSLNFDTIQLARYQKNSDRLQLRKQLIAAIQEKCITLTYNQLDTLWKSKNIPFCRISDLSSVFENQLAIDMIINETIEGIQTKKVSNIAFSIS
ncbi:MAG: CaiB/BaiF CoA-transferase family protein [Saprospiraceae bacterium]